MTKQEKEDRWTVLPSQETVKKTIENIEARGIDVIYVNDSKAALEKVKELIPKGAEVMNGSSTTLDEIGFSDHLKSGAHGWNNVHEKMLGIKDGAKQADLRRRSSASEYFLGSVNAISKNGELIAVDASGSRVTAYPFAAKRLILVAGTQKITDSLEEAMKRVREHVFPLENERAKKVYGMGSNTSKWVIIEREFEKGRITLILVNEKLGF